MNAAAGTARINATANQLRSMRMARLPAAFVRQAVRADFAAGRGSPAEGGYAPRPAKRGLVARGCQPTMSMKIPPQAIADYYTALDALHGHGVRNEMGLRSAFQTLLQAVGKKAD